MTSRERVAAVLRREKPDRTPLYGWVKLNLREPIAAAYGSVEAFEDHFAFDLEHLFPNGLAPYWGNRLDAMRETVGESDLTPEHLLEVELSDPNLSAPYARLKEQIEACHGKERFAYVQTPGIFECLNQAFGIENHLCYLLEYADELQEVYARQAKWNQTVANNLIDLGADMIHVSDDWGSQDSLLFSPEIWHSLIAPHHRSTAEAVRCRGAFLSLHSDGYIWPVLAETAAMGYQLVHPFQESAGMDWRAYRQDFADSFSIMGGMCVQTTVGFGDLAKVEAELKRVFELMGATPWICCTSHFVQSHCSIEELTRTFEIARDLANAG
ncbi:MAG: uroporphyrinogen decarboxylase family protein [Opitutales bacterium]